MMELNFDLNDWIQYFSKHHILVESYYQSTIYLKGKDLTVCFNTKEKPYTLYVYINIGQCKTDQNYILDKRVNYYTLNNENIVLIKENFINSKEIISKFYEFETFILKFIYQSYEST